MLIGADELDHVLRRPVFRLFCRRSQRDSSVVARPSPRPAKKPTCDKNTVGGDCDQDKHHNCCGGGGECGYKWCKYTSKCERVGQCVLGGHNDKDKDCCGGGGQCGYTWCSKQNKCTRSWECK